MKVYYYYHNQVRAYKPTRANRLEIKVGLSQKIKLIINMRQISVEKRFPRLFRPLIIIWTVLTTYLGLLVSSIIYPHVISGHLQEMCDWKLLQR